MSQQMRAIEAQRWVDQACYDLETAQTLLQTARYNWCCFIAQQAAEKALKAARIARGDNVERIHSILVLIEGDQRRGMLPLPELLSYRDNARELDKVYIPTRYPNGVPSGIPADFYTEQNGRDCLQWANEIITAVRQML